MRQMFVLLFGRSLAVLFLMVICSPSSAQTCDWTRAYNSVSISQACGYVGIGTYTPHAQLHITGPYGYSVIALIERDSSGADATMLFRTKGANASDWWVGKSGAAWNENFFFSFGGFPGNNLVLTPGGSVGIGTAAPSYKLDVAGDLRSNTSLLTTNGAATWDFTRLSSDGVWSHYNAGGADSGISFEIDNLPRLVVLNSGRVGIGTSTPISSFQLWSNSANNPIKAEIEDAGGKDGLLTLNAAGVGNVGGGGGILLGGNQPNQFFAALKSLLMNGSGNSTGDLAFSTRNDPADTALTERMRILANGNVGIGTSAPAPGHKLHVVGNAHFTGTVTGQNIEARFQDLAEWVPSTEELTASTVVVLKRDASNTVIASTRAYDVSVAGVVSAQPGISLGFAGPGKVQVATTGRVRVRVDATRGSIAVGDLLVTSDIPGTAMRSEPISLQGVALHRPGTIIGKALEPMANGAGEILVLLSLQ